ncbi:MAG: hypothetical protein FJZ83_05795 [Chloroflexi bacterium]|nr:hypothetical protein [Chloroflexota bacterium]MBM3183530.1 hypothetical protein [Chloroflexota bacterium]MBM4451543.1 hypothetical protein [Chloroflexota bacterium]MBM4454195.1 hypothetical protein [Chloroflexota bacterium]
MSQQKTTPIKRTLAITGFIAFLLGLVIAILAGLLAPDNPYIIMILVLLGVLIGSLNITTKEILPLLLATIALVVVGDVFSPIKMLGIGSILDSMLRLLATLMAPAAVIAAIKALVAIGFPKDE